MKKRFKILVCLGLILTFGCSLFAETSKKQNASADLKVIESLQNSFRSISQTMLPSVVEVDVTETQTVSNPFGRITDPFEYFFGFPFGGSNNNKNDKDNKDNNKSNEYEFERSGLGSGVIVRKNGNTFYVLTNNHVAGNAKKIVIKLNDGREFEGKLVGADERIDIALVSFESKDSSIPVAVLGDSDTVQPGDICLAFGAPLGYSQSVTQGIVSAVDRSENQMSSISNFIQTDAAINQGNSGGPLVNIYGEVIGINTWIASSSGGSVGLGFAIPINNIKNAIDSFIKDGKIVYGWVGVTLLEVSDELKKDLGVEGIDGAFISSVVINSPAYKAGIKPGDYIVSLNSKKVKDSNQLVREIGYFEAGSSAQIGIMRGGKRLPDFTVKIEERASAKEMESLNTWPGFIAQPLTDKLREKLGVKDKKVRGVVISNIEEKSLAASLRLQDGDIITAVNGKTVKNLAEFYTELANATKSINFDVYSNGGTITTGSYKL